MTKPGRDQQALMADIRWNSQGLVPAVVQDATSGSVLMLAWLSRASLELTLDEGRPVYWSRSRGKLWRKGESSGNTQKLVAARLDCDSDTLLLLVEQTGPACHTGQSNCFFQSLV